MIQESFPLCILSNSCSILSFKKGVRQCFLLCIICISVIIKIVNIFHRAIGHLSDVHSCPIFPLLRVGKKYLGLILGPYVSSTFYQRVLHNFWFGCVSLCWVLPTHDVCWLLITYQVYGLKIFSPISRDVSSVIIFLAAQNFLT